MSEDVRTPRIVKTPPRPDVASIVVSDWAETVVLVFDIDEPNCRMLAKRILELRPGDTLKLGGRT